MEFRRLAADDEVLDQVVDLYNAAWELENPWSHPVTVPHMRGQILNGWDGQPDDFYVGTEGDQVVAVPAFFAPQWDNPELAWIALTVHPEHRGRGLGSEGLDFLLGLAVEAGRTKIGSDAWEGSSGTSFLEKRGFEKGSQAILRRQHLADVSLDEVRRLYDEASAAASAYELVRVLGETPDDLMPAVAEMTASINDAPNDDLDLEDEVFPPERIREYEQAQVANGARLHRLLVRHRETGVLAGHSVVAVDSLRPAVAHQHDTTVVRDHRGHRLGLLLKAGMVLWLAEREPQVETVDTWNAESNAHMIAVNEMLGYRWTARELQYMKHTA